MGLWKRWRCNWKLQEDGGNLIQPWWIRNWGEGKINYPKETQTGKREPTYGVAFAIQISCLTTSEPSPPTSGWTAICQDMYTGEFYKKTETGFVDRSRTHFFSLFSLLFALFRWSSLSRFSAFLQHALSRGDRHLSKQAKVSLLECTFTRSVIKPGKRLWEATHSLFKCFTNVRDCALFWSPFSQWQWFKTNNMWLVAASNTGIYITSDQ